MNGPELHKSATGESTVHGGAEFKLYVLDRESFTSRAQRPNSCQPDGQVLVKINYKDDVPQDVYIMIKRPQSRDSAGGWIYGTATPTGRVTAVGALPKCLSCHAKARDHLIDLTE